MRIPKLSALQENNFWGFKYSLHPFGWLWCKIFNTHASIYSFLVLHMYCSKWTHKNLQCSNVKHLSEHPFKFCRFALQQPWNPPNPGGPRQKSWAAVASDVEETAGRRATLGDFRDPHRRPSATWGWLGYPGTQPKMEIWQSRSPEASNPQDV
jgi:hypothetical protein